MSIHSEDAIQDMSSDTSFIWDWSGVAQLSCLLDFTRTQSPDGNKSEFFSSCLPKQGEPALDRIVPWLDSREKISVTKACKPGFAVPVCLQL